MWQSLVFICSGAALGASLRWGLGIWLNGWFNTFAFGTLIANLLGCFLIGIFTALFWLFPSVSPSIKLFLTTGFLGSLTTFSAFSAEVVENLINGKLTLGLEVLALHLFGCLMLTALGIIIGKWIWHVFG